MMSSAQTTATDSFQKARGTDRIDRRNAAMGIDALLGEMRTYAREVQSDTEGSLQALASVVRSLAWEDGEKALVYVSDGLVERPLGTFIQHAQTIMTGGATTAGVRPFCMKETGQLDGRTLKHHFRPV